ncbi:benzoate transporter [Capnocytophaga stomatis]|uniref:Benzoate transporter n=1 Tax=Capnocytophaga stomatis TaxID=1848904 RepID=A0A250FVD3_9FLAO|nr:glycosyltransferase family A protein [Capnocytophaga stomatis]ATA89053.1 benzoate transporter [Capnocytophaga stomatis]
MKISVIIPMYNASKTIVKALNSVQNQTYKCDYEIIIINDGSQDESREVVENYMRQHPDLDITLINQKNGGAAKARNEGLKKSVGKYIAFLDADDEWLPMKIEKQVQVFESSPDVDLLGTNRNEEVFNTFLGVKFQKLTKLNPKLLLIKNFLSPPTVMMKKEILSNTGFFKDNQRYFEEGEYWLRVCANNNCYLFQESLVITGAGKPHFGHSGLSSNLWEMEKGELKNIKVAHDMKIINPIEFFLLNIYSILKYIRRVIIVSLRKLK